MASKRNIRRKFQNNSCGQKLKYATKLDALRDLHRINRNRPDNLSSYLCKFCKCWHNGHRKKEFTDYEKKLSYSSKYEKRKVLEENNQRELLKVNKAKDRFKAVFNYNLMNWENEGGRILFD